MVFDFGSVENILREKDVHRLGGFAGTLRQVTLAEALLGTRPSASEAGSGFCVN